MSWSDLWRRLSSRRQLTDDIRDELRFHIEGRVEALMEEGVPEEVARARVRRAFGDAERIAEECRAIGEERMRRERREAWIDGLRRDLGTAVRGLRRTPGFTAVALVTLGLGIGANTAMFSVLEAVLLRPLPYPEPDRLVRVWPGKNFNTAMVEAFGEGMPSLEGITGIAVWRLTIAGEGPAEEIRAAVVSPEHFSVLGIPPRVGRGFLPEEGRRARNDVVVLSDGFWRRRFGGDPEIVGRRIPLEGQGRETREVVGVAAPGFRPLETDVDAWIPLTLPPGRTVATDSTWYVGTVVGRLAEGVTVERASAEAGSVARELKRGFPAVGEDAEIRAAGVVPLHRHMVGDVRETLWVLFGAVGLVLLIACVNLANLLLARGSGRGREMAIRTALGASRGRLVRQRLTEAATLGVAGGALGVGFASATLEVLGPGLEAALPRGGSVGVDAGVLAFTLAVSLASALVFGLFPAIRSSGPDPRAGLRAGGRGRTAPRGAHRLNRGLVAAEVALATVLVVGAGLVLRSFWSLHGTDPGFDPRGVVVAQVAPPESRFVEGGERRAYFDRVMRRLEAIPGADGVGGIQLLPLTAANWSFPYLAEGHRPPEDEPLPKANFRVVTPGYFRTMRIPVLRGRPIREGDGGPPRNAVVNETMARLLWPGEEAVGREVLLFGNEPLRVVGVVGDVRQHALDSEPAPEIYVSYEWWTRPALVLVVRGADGGSVPPDLVREAVWSVDPEVPISLLRPLDEVLSESVAEPRFFAILLGAFGLLALSLGAAGVYGVMAYHVGSRVPEFGVKLALGARPGDIVGTALRSGLLPVTVGLALGLAGAVAGSRLLSEILHGVEPTDPLTYGVVAVTLAGVGAVASWLPARRAASVDPVRVLTTE